MADQTKLFEFADRMIEKGYELLKAAEAPIDDHWQTSPTAVARALMARTLSNAKVAVLLVTWIVF